MEISVGAENQRRSNVSATPHTCLIGYTFTSKTFPILGNQQISTKLPKNRCRMRVCCHWSLVVSFFFWLRRLINYN